MLSEKHRVVVEKVAKEHGFNNFSISVEKGSKKGDNYLGNIFSITVSDKHRDRKSRYILKCAETNEEVRNQFPIYDAYEREIYVYETLLPIFNQFQDKHKLKYCFKSYARILASSLEVNKEFLLLEDIRDRNFVMLDRKKTMENEYVSLVFGELAKFHSISFAMQHLEPELYKKLSGHMEDYFQKYEHIMNSFQENCKNVFKTLFKIMDANKKATETLVKLQDDFVNIMADLKDDKTWLVIIHGDAWCNNMMFKHEDESNTSKPTSMCFLDWQLSRVQSPVTDLYYFLFLCGSKYALDNHKKYFDLYYRILDENLQCVGCDIRSVFPRDLFEDHWLRYSKLGLFLAVGSIRAMLKDESEANTFVEMAEGGKPILDQFFKDDTCTEEYIERIKNIVNMMVEHGYL